MRFTPLVALAVFTAGHAQGLSPSDLRRLTFDQHVGRHIPTELIFRDSAGSSLRLSDCINGKPTLLVLGYYRCPMLCTVINNGLIAALRDLPLRVGRDFNVISVSIDPTETTQIAEQKKREYLQRYGRSGAKDGWRFLVGDEPAISSLTEIAGFNSAYDPESRQFAHPSGFIVLTPDGAIYRYFFGVTFKADELNTALIAAGQRQQGRLVDQLLFLCFHYNPITGKYGPLILTVVRAAAIATALGLAIFVILLGRNRRPASAASD